MSIKQTAHKKLPPHLAELAFKISQSTIVDYCSRFIQTGKSINEFMQISASFNQLHDKAVENAFIQYFKRFNANIYSPLPYNNIFPFLYVGTANKMNRYTLEVYGEVFYQQKLVKHHIYMNIQFILKTAKKSNQSNIDQDDDDDDIDDDYIIEDNDDDEKDSHYTDHSTLNVEWEPVRISNIRLLIAKFIKSNPIKQNKNKKIEVVISLNYENQMDKIHICNKNIRCGNNFNVDFVSNQINNAIDNNIASDIGICTISLKSNPFPDHYISMYLLMGDGNHLFGSRIFLNDFLKLIPKYFENNDIEETKCYLERIFKAKFAPDDEYNNHAIKFGVDKQTNDKYVHSKYQNKSGKKSIKPNKSVVIKVTKEPPIRPPVPVPVPAPVHASALVPLSNNVADNVQKIIQAFQNSKRIFDNYHNNIQNCRTSTQQQQPVIPQQPIKPPTMHANNLTNLCALSTPDVSYPYASPCTSNTLLLPNLNNQATRPTMTIYQQKNGKYINHKPFLPYNSFRAAGNFWMHESLTFIMMGLCTLDFDNNARAAFSYFKMSVAMQIADKQLNIFITNIGEYIIINIDLYFKSNPKELIYIIADANLPNKIARWKIKAFRSATQINQTYGIPSCKLPQSSRELHKYANKFDVKSSDININKVLKETIFKKIPIKATTKNGNKKKAQLQKQIQTTFDESLYQSFLHDINQYLLPVIVVKDGNHWIEYKRFIKSIKHDKYFAVSFRKLNDNYAIECIDFNMDRIFYQHLLIADTNRIDYKIATQYAMIG